MFIINSHGEFTKAGANPKYQTVLRVRKIQERKAQGELRELQEVCAQEKETLADIKETQLSAVTDAVRSMKMKATEAQTSRAFILKLSRQLREQESKVKDVQSQEDEKRDELIGRTKSKEIVEKLDQQLQAEHAKELDRREQRLIDVLAQRIRTQE